MNENTFCVMAEVELKEQRNEKSLYGSKLDMKPRKGMF